MMTVKFNGNLGNKLFELWSLFGIAAKEKHAVEWPESEIYDYFEGTFPIVQVTEGTEFQYYEEPGFEYMDTALSFLGGHTTDRDNVCLKGYFQSERYWLHCEKELRKMFKFKPQFTSDTIDKIGWQLFDKKVICISIRRGDFVGNKTYYQLPAMYYIGALLFEFPDYANCSILILSDDMDYCKAHFDCLPNVYYADGLNAFEQLCLGSMAQYHIISNSTFSWWCAYLSKSKKVIRPKYNFGEEYRKLNPENDFWPATKDWQVFDHEGYKIDLKDTTFMIPVFHDHADRKNNLDLSVCMLLRDFDTNIRVMENNGVKFMYMSQWTEYESVKYQHFHRTKMLNQMALKTTTPWIVNWDADVVVPPLQVYLAIRLLRNKAAHFVYPYDGRFTRVTRKPYFMQVSKALDIGVLRNADQYNHPNGIKGRLMSHSSVGGAVAMCRDYFILSGMENEHMISYAPEDCERWDRWHKLGFLVARIKGKLYHMDHWCGPDSCSRNPYFLKNHQELDKIRAMTREQLQQYLQTWDWAVEALPALTSMT